MTPEQNKTKETPKTYLYHMVPQNLEGTSIHPLSTLRQTHPHLFIEESAKYEGREHVPKKFISELNASWEDVVQLTAVHPAEIKQALIEAGFDPKEMSFYEIDPELLDPEKTTIYLYNEDEYLPFDPNDLEKHSRLPESTFAHYKEMFAQGKPPFLFVGIPHILHKGSIDISKLRTIKV